MTETSRNLTKPFYAQGIISIFEQDDGNVDYNFEFNLSGEGLGIWNIKEDFMSCGCIESIRNSLLSGENNMYKKKFCRPTDPI